MSHSVSSHLKVEAAQYDSEILRLVPHYRSLLEAATDAVEHLVNPNAHLLDVGSGTGSLAYALCSRLSRVRVTLLDVDGEMLKEAAKRLGSFSAQTTFLKSDFSAPFPMADAAVASLSLHHVHDAKEKVETYRRLRHSCRTLVSADAFVCEEKNLRELTMARWAQHLVKHGDSQAQATARFSQWAVEDRYYSLEQEFSFLRAAGFESVDVWYRQGPMAVLVAT
jgi:ubiquinone/menaquinone biosynthesis C-methylase UbiE